MLEGTAPVLEGTAPVLEGTATGHGATVVAAVAVDGATAAVVVDGSTAAAATTAAAARVDSACVLVLQSVLG